MNKLLNFNVQGEGEALVIIHGLFGSSRNWKTLSRQFAAHYRVITLDLRNHGDSFHADGMSYRQMTLDVIAVLDALDLTTTHVIGHSMGGKVAMALTHDYSQRIGKLVIADVAPVAYHHDYSDIIEPVLALDIERLRDRRDADTRLQAAIPEQRIRQFILQNLQFNEGVARWKLNWRAIRDNMVAITGFEDISNWKIDTPTLFLRGEQSSYIDARGRATIEQHFTNARIQTLPNAGHWLHAEQATLFYQAVISFLGSN